jgi:hypothetical protein
VNAFIHNARVRIVNRDSDPRTPVSFLIKVSERCDVCYFTKHVELRGKIPLRNK